MEKQISKKELIEIWVVMNDLHELVAEYIGAGAETLGEIDARACASLKLLDKYIKTPPIKTK